ncbi:hypothetical protein BJ165DRAFT_1571637 [Panaeolus papilionaceus]|nr:hypothetical protein BJ165DRAFT_1571637 [Panaeolus papilionaceus]
MLNCNQGARFKHTVNVTQLIDGHLVLSSSLSSAFVFEKNEDGFPILPSIDFEEADLGEIRRILTEYLEMMWYHIYPQDSTIPSLPWAEIVLNPHLYYDCATFNLSHSFNNPIPCKTAHVVTLYERLLELQDDQNHFRFYTRSEIISNLQRHLDEAAEESEKGREDVEVVAHPIKSSGQVAKYTPPPSPNPPLSPASSDDLDLDNPTSAIRATLPPTPPMPSDVVCNDDRTVDDALGLAQSGEWFSPLATSTPLESLSLETHLSVPSHSPTILAPSHHHNTVVSTLTDQPLNKDIPKTSKQVTKRKRPSGTGETGEKRKSMRTRNAVQFGVQTIANGARSPKARKAHWEYVDEEERAASGDVEEKENPPAKKSRVI